MMPFDMLFPDVASREYRALAMAMDETLAGQLVFREHYCADRGCDCRRVLLRVTRARGREVVATINYAFETSEPLFDDEPQIMLDPLNPQSDLSEVLLDRFERMLDDDASYHEQLVRHYTMWKAVVDDPSHPDHPKVGNETHDDPAFVPAFAPREPFRRSGPKIGPNDPCPCGSGKKLKKCCRE